MNRRLSLFLLFLLGNTYLWAQTDSTSTQYNLLNAVVVTGYASDRPLNEVPASIGIVDNEKLQRFNSTSFLPAVNMIPGVRMEERSPGSYRFAIRGSSLRSPFGVRNVKIYWNGLPLTDGGGNTYLNLIDFDAIGRAEVIKGPGSSLYGAGTGGVVLLSSPGLRARKLQFSTSIGSYGLQRYQGSGVGGSQKVKFQLQFAHQQSNGYRIQSAMRRDALNAQVSASVSRRSTLSAALFYTDLFYETPGGLTVAEYNSNKKQSRPNTPAFAGAVAQDASIRNKTFYSGLTYEHDWNEHWSHRSGLYGSYTDFTNPAIRNYEQRIENNFGGRTQTQYTTEAGGWKGKLTFGGEFQYFKSPLADYGNRNGVRDTLQFSDRIGSTQTVVFAQTEIDLPSEFFLSLGASTTFLQYRFIRTSIPQPQQQTRNFAPVLSPRVALLKKLGDEISVYASASKGFSTPSLAEVRPSSNSYNKTLNPETGWSFEAGLRGSLQRTLSFELTAYYFQLQNTIVTPDGGDHYINSGKTSQPGIEGGVRWTILDNRNRLFSNLVAWTNVTYNPYTFRNYFVGSADYSGTKLTGVARDISVSGIDVSLQAGWYGSFTTTHTGAIPLKDGNIISAPSYYLIGVRVGFRHSYSKGNDVDVFSGVENASNTRYSLGNDLNAAGGRYFNTAAPQSFYIGMKISM